MYITEDDQGISMLTRAAVGPCPVNHILAVVSGHGPHLD